MDAFTFLCALTTGSGVAAAAYACRGRYAELVEAAERDLSGRLRTLHVSVTWLRPCIHVHLAVVAAVFWGGWLGMEQPGAGLLAALLLSAGPWYLVRWMAQARQQKIEQQLADAMSMFSTAIRAGLSLVQALELLACECHAPIRQEFAQIIGQYQLGKPLERTLTEARQRLRSENFALFAASLLASRQSGGRLSETVQRISQAVVELQRLERKVAAETAQARKSAIYMALVPPVVLVGYYFVDPDNTRLLLVTLPGKLLLAAAVGLNLLAYLWARKILHADI